MESSRRQLSHGGILDRSYQFKNLSNLPESKSDNIDASGLPNSSSESLCPKPGDTRCAGVAATENCADATLEEVDSVIKILHFNLFLFFKRSFMFFKKFHVFFNRNVLGVAHGDG